MKNTELTTEVEDVQFIDVEYQDSGRRPVNHARVGEALRCMGIGMLAALAIDVVFFPDAFGKLMTNLHTIFSHSLDKVLF